MLRPSRDIDEVVQYQVLLYGFDFHRDGVYAMLSEGKSDRGTIVGVGWGDCYVTPDLTYEEKVGIYLAKKEVQILYATRYICSLSRWFGTTTAPLYVGYIK